MIPLLINFTVCNQNHKTRENLVWKLVLNHFHLYSRKSDTAWPISFPVSGQFLLYPSSPTLHNLYLKTSQTKLTPVKTLVARRNTACWSIFSCSAFSLGQRTYTIAELVCPEFISVIKLSFNITFNVRGVLNPDQLQVVLRLKYQYYPVASECPWNLEILHYIL